MTFIRRVFELYQPIGRGKAGFRTILLAFMALESYIYSNYEQKHPHRL